MTLNTWLLFAGAVVLLTASPGPNALLALTHGVRHGAGRAAATVAGSLVAFMILLGVSLAGLGALLTASATAFQVLKWVGAAYLIYLGVRTWRSEPKSIAGEESGEGKSLRRRRDLFRDGFLVAISNPKIIMFFAAFFPQFINPGAAWLPQVAVLALTFVGLEAMWQLTYAGGGSKIARWLDESGAMRWFHRVTGGLFVGAGLLVLLSKKWEGSERGGVRPSYASVASSRLSTYVPKRPFLFQYYKKALQWDRTRSQGGCKVRQRQHPKDAAPAGGLQHNGSSECKRKGPTLTSRGRRTCGGPLRATCDAIGKARIGPPQRPAASLRPHPYPSARV